MTKLTFPLATLFALVAAGQTHADVLYSTVEDFTISAHSNLDNVTVGWLGYYGNSTTAKVAATSTGNHRIGIYNGNAATGGGLNDYLFFQKNNGVTDMDFFAHTASQSNFESFAPEDYSSLSATWLVTPSDVGTNGYRLTIEVDSTWWATSVAIGSGFNYLTTSWIPILDTASGLSLGSTTTTSEELFADDALVTGVGFYVNQQAGPTSTLRIDNFAIQGTAVPEPSVGFLGLTGIGYLLARRRRRAE